MLRPSPDCSLRRIAAPPPLAQPGTVSPGGRAGEPEVDKPLISVLATPSSGRLLTAGQVGGIVLVPDPGRCGGICSGDIPRPAKRGPHDNNDGRLGKCHRPACQPRRRIEPLRDASITILNSLL